MTLSSEILTKLQSRATFRHWTLDVIRFSDTDMVGHVNNAAYACYCETGRVAFNRHLFQMDDANTSIVLARLAIDYRHETFYPGTIEIGSALLRIGTSSLSIVQGLFVGELAVATSEAVIVLINPETRKSTKIPEDVRTRLSERLIGD
jgi:acyl-CoA thioester hydrolase